MSHYFFTDAHDVFRRAVRRFVNEEIKPHIQEWEEAGEFPSQIFRRLGQLGYLGIRYPREYGGAGGDFFMAVVLAEELAGCGAGSLPMAVAVQTEMALPPIFRFGTEEQKQRFLVPGLRGEKIACLGITEPNAGSDVASVETKAVRQGKEWVINGSKIFITNGVRADFIVLVAKTAPPKGYHGFSLFLVEKGTPGFSVKRKLDKVGMRASDTAELVFTDCHIPEENLLGEENKGFHHIMWELQGERLMGAVGIIAAAQYTLDEAIAYAKERVQFGRPIASFQTVAHRIAELTTLIEAARQFTYVTVWRFANGEYPVKEISMAKLASAQIACQVADLAVQIHGGYGLMMEYPVQRAFRDYRLYRIGGGTDEIMKEIIAQEVSA